MILECPNCQARFRVADEAVGPGGRRVRCGACDHVWHAVPEGGEDSAYERADRPIGIGRVEPEADVFDVAAQNGAETAPETAAPEPEAASVGKEITATMRRLRGESDEEAGPSGSQGAAGRGSARPGWIGFGWAAWVLFVVAILAGGWLFRAELQSAWPASLRLYEALGLAEAPPEPPVRADALRVRIDSDPEWQALQDGWRVIVSGSVTNTANLPVELGSLTLELVDDSGAVLRRAAVGFERDTLEAGVQTAFRIAIEDAPARTTGILYEWGEKG